MQHLASSSKPGLRDAGVVGVPRRSRHASNTKAPTTTGDSAAEHGCQTTAGRLVLVVHVNVAIPMHNDRPFALRRSLGVVLHSPK